MSLRKKYVPHLPSILATCEQNYAYALRLLPDCDSESLSYQFQINDSLSYRITIIESTRYTSTIEMAQFTKNAPAFLQPLMEVRLYHDAKVAEVLSCQRISRLEPSYEYPNLNMHQRNEKQMVNIFLAEWLQFCLQQHREVITTNQD
ncbi:DUF1249 domain-containing protein [Glaciecola sp. MH2013]|uniref:DUF1249 domain-containing protein n=1 Tax=Glaciecola sp. MH2013 TaxID=2785524 RepID=UPI0018A097FA|nr:DUF1249 domain-containing protein [Glaciecola sp. MH2013]MBF7071882.1 DUF1249 domain-containing protein [Glaciecola sp. MH2013]